MKKVLVVFNTCGISGRENVGFYINAINNILAQNFQDCRICISSCLNTPATQDILTRAFGNLVTYNFINEPQPVNVTFNKSVQDCVNHFGEFETYLYLDSGVDFEGQVDIISTMYNLHKSGPYGMTSTLATNDNGTEWFLGYSGAPPTDFIVPVGKSLNLHCQIFDNEIYRNFDKRLMPDIFRSFCSESVLSFICAAIKKKWVIVGNRLVYHLKANDGPSSGFPNRHSWDDTYLTPKTMAEIIADPIARSSGFGYEECGNIFIHDHSKYDEEGYVRNDELRKFILENIFLSKELLDYDKIYHRFIP